MIIAVDGRPIVYTQTGIANYLNEILKYSDENRINLYTPKNVRNFYKSTLRSNHNIQNKVIYQPSLRGFAKEFWQNYYLPLAINLGKDQLFWGPSFYAPKNVRCNKVVTIHDVVFRKYPKLQTSGTNKAFDRAIKDSIPHTDLFISVSQSTKKDFCHYYEVDEEKVIVIYHGYNEYFDTTVEKESIASTLAKLGIANPFILFTGGIVPRKNLKRLISAYNNSSANNEDISLIIAGPLGWLYDDVVELIKENKNIRHLGFVSNEDLRVLYQSCLFFTYPSIYEGFGIPPLEAMASGAALLTSNVSSMLELYKDCAYMVDPFSVDSITSGLDAMLDDSIRQDLITKGYAKSRTFSWKKSAKEHFGIFKNILGD